jgi:hypothetical protein
MVKSKYDPSGAVYVHGSAATIVDDVHVITPMIPMATNAMIARIYPVIQPSMDGVSSSTNKSQ